MKRIRKLVVAGISVVGTACLSAWMALLGWSETLPPYAEGVLGIVILFLVGAGFGFLLAIIFLRR